MPADLMSWRNSGKTSLYVANVTNSVSHLLLTKSIRVTLTKM